MTELKVLFIELDGTVYTIKTVLSIIDLLIISAEYFNKILINGNIHINEKSIPVIYPVDNYQLLEKNHDHYLVVLGNEENNTGIIVDKIIGLAVINWNDEETVDETDLSATFLN